MLVILFKRYFILQYISVKIKKMSSIDRLKIKNTVRYRFE